MKLLASILFKLSYLQNCTLTPKKGHNSTRGDNAYKNKTGQLFSDQESINKIPKPYGSFKQVDQRATIAHLRANINIWGHFRCSRAANSTVSSPIWLKFDFIQNIMYVLITCKFKKYRINSKWEQEDQWSCKRSPDILAL